MRRIPVDPREYLKCVRVGDHIESDLDMDDGTVSGKVAWISINGNVFEIDKDGGGTWEFRSSRMAYADCHIWLLETSIRDIETV